jgi:hypothetical protein
MSKTETLVKTENNGEKQLARPLNVLIPLIKGDLQEGMEAGIIYFKAAGEKLIEAKLGGEVSVGQWSSWLKSNFRISVRTAKRYMQLAGLERLPSGAETGETTMSELLGDSRHGHGKGGWGADVRERVKQARKKARAYALEKHTRAQERAAERDLGLRLIDIGFKILSFELHPDKGGTHDAMRRLNAVRARLKECA